MSDPQGDIKTCQECGASVYPEHVNSRKAGLWAGKLLCPVCYQKHQSGVEPASKPPQEPELESIAMVADSEISSIEQPGIGSLGGEVGSAAAGQNPDANLHRSLAKDANGATRCRTFHAKLNDGAVAFMNNQVNEWCDANEDITIKFATSTIGVFEGKHTDPHLIITIFY